MGDARKYDALCAQSGGQAAVTNATACSVIAAIHNQDTIHALFAAKRGALGLLEASLIDTRLPSNVEIEKLRYAPNVVFEFAGISSRMWFNPHFPSREC